METVTARGGRGSGKVAASGPLSPKDRELLRTWGTIVVVFEGVSTDAFAQVDAATGLPRSSFELLWRLSELPGYSAPMTFLARTLIFSSGGMTKLADRLIAAGHVDRVPSATDRRVVNLVLTDAGLEAAHTASRVFLEALRNTVVARLGEERLAQLAHLMSLCGDDVDGDPSGLLRAAAITR